MTFFYTALAGNDGVLPCYCQVRVEIQVSHLASIGTWWRASSLLLRSLVSTKPQLISHWLRRVGVPHYYLSSGLHYTTKEWWPHYCLVIVTVLIFHLISCDIMEVGRGRGNLLPLNGGGGPGSPCVLHWHHGGGGELLSPCENKSPGFLLWFVWHHLVWGMEFELVLQAAEGGSLGSHPALVGGNEGGARILSVMFNWRARIFQNLCCVSIPISRSLG